MEGDATCASPREKPLGKWPIGWKRPWQKNSSSHPIAPTEEEYDWWGNALRRHSSEEIQKAIGKALLELTGRKYETHIMRFDFAPKWAGLNAASNSTEILLRVSPPPWRPSRRWPEGIVNQDCGLRAASTFAVTCRMYWSATSIAFRACASVIGAPLCATAWRSLRLSIQGCHQGAVAGLSPVKAVYNSRAGGLARVVTPRSPGITRSARTLSVRGASN